MGIGGDSVLSDRYRLEQVSQTSDVLTSAGDRLKAGDQIWLYGGVDYTGGGRLGTGIVEWASLPGTKVETDAILRYGETKGMRMTLLSGVQATEESVKALDGKGYPAVLHLATHGFCYPVADTADAGPVMGRGVAPGAAFMKASDPLMRSGIVLSGGDLGWNGMAASGTDDGILTAYEVSNLYLPSVRLVVLSACETALGEIQGTEGVYGLARAFRMAGVQNLVMSLWTVPDGPTAEFMGVMYHHLFDGESVSAAFRAAQEEMKKKYRKEPGKWAAWILVR
jgi:CHAT domain-containing protein